MHVYLHVHVHRMCARVPVHVNVHVRVFVYFARACAYNVCMCACARAWLYVHACVSARVCVRARRLTLQQHGHKGRAVAVLGLLHQQLAVVQHRGDGVAPLDDAVHDVAGVVLLVGAERLGRGRGLISTGELTAWSARWPHGERVRGLIPSWDLAVWSSVIYDHT